MDKLAASNRLVKRTLKAVEDGLVKSISKGLYEEGLSSNVNKVKFKM